MWFFCYDIDEILGCRQRREGVGSCTEEWLDAWAERVIREVDSSELISEGMVKSPVLGPITIREISSGAKALITMNADDSVISNANSCGDNCAALLAELSRKKDFAVYLAYPMNFEGLEFDMCIARDGAVCHSAEELDRKSTRLNSSHP